MEHGFTRIESWLAKRCIGLIPMTVSLQSYPCESEIHPWLIRPIPPWLDHRRDTSVWALSCTFVLSWSPLARSGRLYERSILTLKTFLMSVIEVDIWSRKGSWTGISQALDT